MDEEKLNDWILKHYPNFKFKYWLTTEQPEIASYMKRLMFNSFSKSVTRQQNNPEAVNKEVQFRRELPEIIHIFEDFFAAGKATGLIHDSNRLKILNKMKNTCEYVEFLPKELSGVYGRTKPDNKCVQINSNMAIYSGRRNLTPYEVRKLYLFHELGHTVLNIANHPIIEQFYNTYSSVIAQKGKNVSKPRVPQLIGAGFLMIEECLVQEMAEKFAYYIASKPRPQYTVTQDLGINVETNMDYYGIFQKPTIELGTTMRGCGSTIDTSNATILEGMLNRALNHDFVPDLISEYDEAYDGSPDAYEDLMNIIIEMGVVCDKKYESFGQGLVEYPYTGNVLQALTNIQKRAKKYEDFRDYPQNGFPPMDFNNPNIRHRQQILEQIDRQQDRVSKLIEEKKSILDRIYGRYRSE